MRPPIPQWRDGQYVEGEKGGFPALPNATFIATYIGGCLAGIRLLRGHKIGRIAAWISLVVTLGLYPFLGWPALYPLVIVVMMYFKGKRKSR